MCAISPENPNVSHLPAHATIRARIGTSNLTSARASARARIAGFSRGVARGKRPPDDPELIEAKRELAALTLQETVETLIADWPPLTTEQVENVVALLRAGTPTEGGDGKKADPRPRGHAGLSVEFDGLEARGA
jgi:hypothetical protein